jgi:uncharacterized Zn finger protein (UPF0148 family)
MAAKMKDTTEAKCPSCGYHVDSENADMNKAQVEEHKKLAHSKATPKKKT